MPVTCFVNAPVEEKRTKQQDITCNPAHYTTKQGSRYGPLVCLYHQVRQQWPICVSIPPSKAVDMAHLCVYTTKQGSRYGPLVCLYYQTRQHIWPTCVSIPLNKAADMALLCVYTTKQGSRYGPLVCLYH